MANVIEEAKSGRASCRTCKKPIAKGELRFGEEAPNAFGDEPTLRWHHLTCAAQKLPAELKAALDAHGVVLVLQTTAFAERHVVEVGETLEHVAAGHGCTVEEVMRANHVETTLVKPGTVIEVPACSIKSRARTRSLDDADKARTALAM